jgi:hypothetical protein
MAQSNDHLERLMRELAQLDPADQARVVAGVARLRRDSVLQGKLVIPTLRGGSQWVGDDLSRESMYGDDGR